MKTFLSFSDPLHFFWRVHFFSSACFYIMWDIRRSWWRALFRAKLVILLFAIYLRIVFFLVQAHTSVVQEETNQILVFIWVQFLDYERLWNGLGWQWQNHLCAVKPTPTTTWIFSLWISIWSKLFVYYCLIWPSEWSCTHGNCLFCKFVDFLFLPFSEGLLFSCKCCYSVWPSFQISVVVSV